MVLCVKLAKMKMKMKKGFTLIEMTMVVIILIVLVGILLATFNPIKQLNKGHDATRKKDLKRIGIAFEEYYNDKGCYPSQAMIDALSCGSHDFYSLNPWPCDPRGGRYNVLVDDSQCPGWFTVTTRLETEGENRECNYGVASTNRDWREENVCYSVIITPTPGAGGGATTNTPTPLPADCCDPGNCMTNVGGNCNSTMNCSGDSCYQSGESCPGYTGDPCMSICKTASCGQ